MRHAIFGFNLAIRECALVIAIAQGLRVHLVLPSLALVSLPRTRAGSLRFSCPIHSLSTPRLHKLHLCRHAPHSKIVLRAPASLRCVTRIDRLRLGVGRRRPIIVLWLNTWCGCVLALRELVLLSFPTAAIVFPSWPFCTYSSSCLLSIGRQYRRYMTPHLYGIGMRPMDCKRQARG